ncbi:uncharacterized protein LOC126373377 [Pectinophora gossypiella]|uniref:uncharacterized protein LOC126373377 n=1 Tax=Pectinophora gossypiella TaxID=13191 RepID=UPI00214F4709|nr:uncharacterized protein LOC126373377 [Pectinophora gossypiella]
MKREGFNCSWNLETGSFTFGVFNAIISSFGFIASVVFAIYAIHQQIYYELNHHHAHFYYHFGPLASGSMILTTTGVLGISVAFAVILCIGIRQRKAEYVKWYFVYGIVVNGLVLATVLALIIIIIEFIDDVDSTAPMIYTCIALVVLSSLFALILVIIRGTYKKFERELEASRQYGQLPAVAVAGPMAAQ